MRQPTTAGRIAAASRIFISLAGVALISLAPDPNFTPLILAFVSAIIGLFVTGSAEFVPNSARIYRASLRVLGFVLLTPMMVVLLVIATKELSGGGIWKPEG